MGRSMGGYGPLEPSNSSLRFVYWDRLCTPFQSEPDAAPVRLIVRRVKPTPGSQLALFATYSYHGFITDRDGEMLETGGRPSPPRRDRECHPRPQARCGVEPSPLGPLRRQRRLAGGTGDGPQHRPLDSTHRSGPACGDHQDPPAALLLPGRTDHPLGAPPHTASATALALGSPVRSCPGPIARPATPCLTAATGRHPANRTSPRTRASPVCECLLLRPLPAISP